MSSLSTTFWAAQVVVALALATPAFAAPLYQVDLQATANSGGVFDGSTPALSDSNPVSLAELRNVDSTTGFGSAAAGPGSVAVIGSSTYTVTDPNNDTDATGIGTAISTIDDVIFSGSGFLNNVFLNLDLSGLMDVSGITDTAQSSLTLSVKLGNQTLNGFRTLQIPSLFFADGELDGVWPQGQTSFDGAIAFGPFDNVPTGVPLSLRMSMSMFTGTGIFAVSSNGDSSSAVGDLGSTLSFTSSGDLFSGVPGSVDSAQGNIANNVWTGSPVTALPIPEPSSLMILAAAAMIASKRRREVGP
ncbi:MAG: PEP-CTERM sorting domain-containing protein [Phycisphaerae bacterium]